MNLAGALFAQGCKVNIQEVNADGDKRFVKPLVDLPSYPWNHTQRYWHESRVEHEYLSRAKPKLSLIGAPAPSLGERAILYPAAGYLAMALEAAFQTTDKTKHVAAYKLRDIQLTSAAIISEEADLECIVQLRTYLSATRGLASTWTEFTVTSSPDGKTLTKKCPRLLLIEYQPSEGSEASKEKALEFQAHVDRYLAAKDSCKDQIDCNEFDAEPNSLGLQYGLAFTNVCDARNRTGQSYGVVEIPDVFGRTLEGCDRPYIIHLGTFDVVFHLAFAALRGGKGSLATAMVSKSIEEVTISAKVPFAVGTKIAGFSNALKHGLRELKAEIVMLGDQECELVIDIQGFVCADVAVEALANLEIAPAVPYMSRNSLILGQGGLEALLATSDTTVAGSDKSTLESFEKGFLDMQSETMAFGQEPRRCTSLSGSYLPGACRDCVLECIEAPESQEKAFVLASRS
ncbi:hypothetical protein BU23DRAFT_602671 [Bimuria novae-zelandiae CBS 107.79]|uniref:PKS/mFAS DH domain-containing protein n=1 Tax=Bimuria novae-zelandiae CBS 107.79 TaxID=1447943 RepID=A0A6A5UVH2_9PLEO|nr:hypothetical protein BU23DRAFT_602671 [Bimuria novae-zelandiae CBS 107.79]